MSTRILRDCCAALAVKHIEWGGTEDHVHIACTLPRPMTTSQLVQEVKASSSKWVKERTGQAAFSWQSGYGAFSLGHSQLGSLIRYIENQQ